MQLENENLCALKKDKIIIYNIQNNKFKKLNEIKLNENKIYYNINHISSNNISFLSYGRNEEVGTFLNFLEFPDYKLEEIKLLDINNETGDLIQIGNLLVICFGLLDYCRIFILI